MFLYATTVFFLIETVHSFSSESHGFDHAGSEREGRFITFNNEDGNVRLEMVFAIPFLHIPIGPTPEGSLKPTVDINIKSLIVAGVTFFVLFVIVPGLIRITLPNTPISRGWENSEAGKLLDRMETSLENLGIDTGACWNQGVCYITQKAEENILKGRASSWEKIINGILSNHWIYPFIPNQLIPGNCSSTIYKCPVMDYGFSDIVSYLTQNAAKFNFNNLNKINLG